ncbi:hypothetical protein E0Z10_g5316 [Xylaria hypoxylon]|uniref:Uncharacterized protein n=1 Tax=Xylaria hypoxylon TaxID=37992 RepID=A0A4Z0YJ37_9PEZI|nr:hypothetical protein E0Z10_g5316 [Xylaria hypoxylon]
MKGSSPFSTRLLKAEPTTNGADGSPLNDEYFLSLLPASYRTDSDNLAPSSGDITACIEKELDLRRLNKVFGWLWMVGRPMPPRPLHHQVLLGREIFVTEQMDMHLVWTTGRMFLKPIPRFLLEPHFWSRYLTSDQIHLCSGTAGAGDTTRCQHNTLEKGALGFLFSYAALITYENDLWLAKEMRLVPKEVEWSGWRTFVEQLDTEHIYPRVDPRFLYGELRLSRLNKIYALSQWPFRSYMEKWQRYRSFFRDNIAWLASATVYSAIILTAMQVGLATKSLGDNNAFQSASYGFTIFSIVGPLAATGVVSLMFCYAFVRNLVLTMMYKKKRFRAMGLGSKTS